MTDIICPLCGSEACDYCKDKNRKYFVCPACELVFVDSVDFLSKTEEKEQYDFHQNCSEDMGYRKFLSRMSKPMTELLSVGDQGLDYGSGPGPTLSVMFEELGYSMDIYDCFYAKDKSVLQRRYDFVTATEVVEHFNDPAYSLDLMWQCLKPGGYLGIMTKRVTGIDSFKNWHYKNDPTHVCFFSIKTFEYLAKYWQAEIVFTAKDVVILRKPVDKISKNSKHNPPARSSVARK
jgi:transcription initiation factor TFIIIB Brf1 subunit/transcription initiation factor TFIIB